MDRMDRLPDLLRMRRRPLPAWRRVVYLGLAAVCLVGGVVGWLIPVVTGIPFYAAGFVLVGLASERARRWVNRLEARLPERTRRALRAGLVRLLGRERLRGVVNLPDEPDARPV